MHNAMHNADEVWVWLRGGLFVYGRSAGECGMGLCGLDVGGRGHPPHSGETLIEL